MKTKIIEDYQNDEEKIVQLNPTDPDYTARKEDYEAQGYTLTSVHRRLVDE